jgi:hypothetical protein
MQHNLPSMIIEASRKYCTMSKLLLNEELQRDYGTPYKMSKNEQ